MTVNRTLWGGGALQVGDLCLAEDGGECSGALGSNVVAVKTAREGQGGNDERVGVSMGADRKADTVGAGGRRT
jgi:hypothetical protein